MISSKASTSATLPEKPAEAERIQRDAAEDERRAKKQRDHGVKKEAPEREEQRVHDKEEQRAEVARRSKEARAKTDQRV